MVYTFAPTSLGIELVRGCNFACPMCPVTANEQYESEKFQFISLDFLRRVVDQIDRHPTIKRVWFFHFGEPMAHPQYEECLRILYASPLARAADVVQHTNASLLRGAKAEAILDIPIIRKLVFSFDGWGDRESFERMRGPHFDKVVRNIRDFAERGGAATGPEAGDVLYHSQERRTRCERSVLGGSGRAAFCSVYRHRRGG